MAAKESGEKTEREPYGRRAAAEEAPHGVFQLHSRPLEEPALEAAPRAGISHVSASALFPLPVAGLRLVSVHGPRHMSDSSPERKLKMGRLVSELCGCAHDSPLALLR